MESERKGVWTSNCQQAFDAVKAMLVARDPLIRFPDLNKPFHIHMDASDIQLGAVIVQDIEPTACSSGELHAAQRNCAVMEKEFHRHQAQ